VTTVSDILAAVDRLAPFRLAEEWDTVGLLLGDADAKVRRVLVSLDVTEAVCEEAECIKAECLFAHHPFFLKGLPRVTAETRPGRLALRLAAGRRAVIVAHTNLDAATGGLNDLLAERAGLEDLEPLRAEPGPARYKVVVFVPEGDLEAVRRAAFEAGAGRIGAYAECSFASPGEGTFFAGEGTKPTVGRRGKRSAVAEHRLEVVVEESRLGAVVAAIGRTASYETPAIDVYPLKALPGEAGLGRIGRLKKAKTLGRFADEVKRALGLKTVTVAGDPSTHSGSPRAGSRGESGQKIERVAVCTGSGNGLVETVRAARCDAYLTGELKYHESQALAAEGIGVVLGGHYETERVPLEDWTPRLAAAVDVEVVLSKTERGALRWK